MSRLIDSAISKEKGDQRKYSFLEKKQLQKEGKWTHYEHLSHHFIDRAMKQSTHQFHKIFFHISKCLACNAETLQLKITKKNEYS